MRFDERNPALMEVMSIPEIQHEISKGFLAYSLAVEKRSTINPRKIVFVDSFFTPVKQSDFSTKGLKQSNLSKYANKINKVSGNELLVQTKIPNKKNKIWFVDLTKSPFNPYNQKIQAYNQINSLKMNNSITQDIPTFYDDFKKLQELKKSQEKKLYNRFFRTYCFLNLFNKNEIEQLDSFTMLKEKLEDYFSKTYSAYVFFNDFNCNCSFDSIAFEKSLKIDFSDLPFFFRDGKQVYENVREEKLDFEKIKPNQN